MKNVVTSGCLKDKVVTEYLHKTLLRSQLRFSVPEDSRLLCSHNLFLHLESLLSFFALPFSFAPPISSLHLELLSPFLVFFP